jgi:spore coat protein U-like protein
MRNLMKNLAIAALMAAAGTSHAGSDSKTFNVTVNLTSKCSLSTPADVAFTYTSFQTGASTATGGGFTVTCTNTLPYTLGFTNTATPASTASGTFTATNLNYSLGLSATSGTGSGVAQSFQITGSMASGQAGTCAQSTCSDTDATKTLYVVW